MLLLHKNDGTFGEFVAENQTQRALNSRKKLEREISAMSQLHEARKQVMI